MFVVLLPWSSIAAANTAVHLIDDLFFAIVGGIVSTVLVLTTRMPAIAAAAVLSTAVFIGTWLTMLSTEASLEFNIRTTAVFFVFGFVFATIVVSILQKSRRKPKTPTI